MELRQVRYFAAVARHRHFTRAAGELGLAQPALSQQVRALERELGVVLIDRGGRRVQLTDAGEAFLVWAERILADVAAAEAEMAEFAGLGRGRVIVGSTPVQTLGRVDLPGLLAAFHARYPGVEVALREETTPILIGELEVGRIDVALGALMGDTVPKGIVAEPLFAEDLVAMVEPSHPLANRPIVRLEELAEERFVLATPGSPIRRAVTDAAAAAGASIRVASRHRSNCWCAPSWPAGWQLRWSPARWRKNRARRWRRCAWKGCRGGPWPCSGRRTGPAAPRHNAFSPLPATT